MSNNFTSMAEYQGQLTKVPKAKRAIFSEIEQPCDRMYRCQAF